MGKVQSMESGPELDGLVAQKVMGLQFKDYPICWPEYSTSIELGWQVLVAFRKPGGSLSLLGKFCDELGELFDVEDDAHITMFNVFANLTPYHICIAALRAIGEKVTI